MTTVKKIRKKCAVCGHVSEQWAVLALSEGRRDSSDLDSRNIDVCMQLSADTPVMYRDLGRFDHEKLINICPECGYADDDLEHARPLSSEDIAFIRSEEYQNTEGIDFISDIAGGYYRLYMFEKSRGNFERAFHAVRRAAWSCDDADDTENADICRVAGAELKDMFVLTDSDMEEATYNVIMDMLRRAGKFDEAIEKYSGVSLNWEGLRERCEFEVVLAKRKDRRCYQAEDAYRYAELVRQTGDPEESADEVIMNAELRRIRLEYYRRREQKNLMKWKEENSQRLDGCDEMEEDLMRDIDNFVRLMQVLGIADKDGNLIEDDDKKHLS